MSNFSDFQEQDEVEDFNEIKVEPKKKSDGRGRKKGAVSFMQVTLGELNRVLKADARVILSLKYAQLVGLSGRAVGADMSVMEYCVNSGKADISLDSFDSPADQSVSDEDMKPKDLKKSKEEDEDDIYVPPLQVDLTSWNE